MLIRSDSVSHLTPIGLQAMAAYGVTTVIDLRTDAELAGAAPDTRFGWSGANVSRAPGVMYLHLPLVASVQPRPDQGPPGIGRYVRIVDDRQAAFGAVFNAIAEADGAVLFHCHAGKDRTGLVAALLLELAGVAREHIAADFGETDDQLAKLYSMWLTAAAPELREEMRADLCCPADRILGMLDHIDTKWEGAANYLERAGVSASYLERLSARLR